MVATRSKSMSRLCEHADVCFAFATGSKGHPDYRLAVSVFAHPKKNAMQSGGRPDIVASRFELERKSSRKRKTYLSSQKSNHYIHAQTSF